MATTNTIRENAESRISQISKIIEARDFSNKTFNELLSQMPEMILTYSKSGYRHEVLDVVDNYKINLYRIAAEMSIEQDPDLNTAYVLGYLKASLNMISQVSRLTERDLKDELPLSIIDKTANVKNMLVFLYDKSVVSHTELAAHLEIKKSALTMAIRRIEPYNFFESKKYGRFKYYYLTAVGKHTYEKYVNQIKVSDTSCNNFVYRLLDLVTNLIQDDHYDQRQVIRKLTTEFPDFDLPRQDRFRLRINRLNRSLQFCELRRQSNRITKTDPGLLKRFDINIEQKQFVDIFEYKTDENDKFRTVSLL